METIKCICPVGDFSCPYCNDEMRCTLEKPFVDCDDFAYYWIEDEEEEENLF